MNNTPLCVREAIQYLASLAVQSDYINSPDKARDYIRMKIGHLEHEVFGMLYLNSQNQVIGHEELFRGTISQTSVYPREVVKAALYNNAAGVVLYHNHPSGLLEPSRADEILTNTLKSALALIDIRMLDHIIVSHTGTVSMAEKGLI